MLSVTASLGDLSITATASSEHYSPDIITDLAVRACDTLIRTTELMDALADAETDD